MPSASTSSRRGHTRLLFVAAAGYGKSAALEAELPDAQGCHRAVDLAASDSLGTGSGQLGVDDFGDLAEPEQKELMRRFAALPPDVRLAVASRSPLAPAVRELMPDLVYERGPTDLALSRTSVARVLRDEHGLEDASLATQVHALTAGWPALVHFAADALVRGESRHLLPALSEPGTAAATWVENQVLGDLPDWVRSVAERNADLDVQSPELWAALLAGEHDRSPDGACRWLRRTGLLVPHPARGRPAETLYLVPVVAAVVRSHARSSATGDAGHERLLAAASWYATHGHPLAAARTLVRAGREATACALVADRGEEMLAAGEATGIVDILRAAPPGELDPARQQLLGDALRMSGDAPGALRAFAPLVQEAHRTNTWRPPLAWRVAMVHYMLADYHAALEVLDRVPTVTGTGTECPDRDEVEVLACRANVLSMLGVADEATAVATSAVRAAAALDDDRAAAAAHLAAANTSTGATKDGHLAQALAAADRARDVVLTARALLNQAYGLLAAARYNQARDVAAEAVHAAEQGSPPGILVTALHNLGEAQRRLGHHAEAELQLQRSVAVSRQLGLQRAAFGLWGMAEIHRELGRREQSAIAYEAAVEAARGTGEVQVLVPALAGLARLRVQTPDELSSARAAADEAEQLACPEFASYALVACGWVAFAEGDHALAGKRAAQALAAARSSAAIDALADALELTAAVTSEPKQARGALKEALAIWAAGGAEPAADRVRVLLGRLSGADATARSEAREAAKRLVRQGAHTLNGQPLDNLTGSSVVEVRLHGGFEVRVGGRVVPVPAWRSKQARTLVKILASRRGRYVTRAELCELLWPDDEPSRTGHRLSVLLSAVRAVLDPDRAWPADHFIAADLCGLSLNVAHVGVDVEQFLRDSAHATELLRAGDFTRAGEILAEVVTAYRGDALEDEPYAEWADGLREQARAALLRSIRNLAKLRGRAGDHHEAATLLVRLLAADPYDEGAHSALIRTLVRAGRHGEARRAFDRWSAAMRSIDAPAPDRRVLQPDRAPRTGPSARTVLTVAR